MANLNNNEEYMEVNVIELEDEDGNSVEFAILDEIEYQDKLYEVLIEYEELNNVSSEGSVQIFEIVQYINVDENSSEDDEDGELVEVEFNPVEDDLILDAVFEIFKNRNEDNFNF